MATISKDSQSLETKHNLTLTLDDTYAFALNVTFFTNKKKLVEGINPQSGSYRNYILPEGNYIVRLEVNGLIADNEISLFEDISYGVGKFAIGNNLKAPELYSSAPIGGSLDFFTSFNYYIQPAVAISRLQTYKNYRVKSRTSGLFIFLRYPDADYFEREKKKKPSWENFTLRNVNGRILAAFPNGWTDDNQHGNYNLRKEAGYIAFSGYLNPGLYFLYYTGADERVIPITIYSNWYSQVFMTVAEQPLFGTLRIFLSKDRTFDPNDRNHLYVDYCLNKIQNGDFTLDSQLIERIAYNKFDSPMLGLLGAYIYLISSETKDDDLFNTIVRNLQQKILRNSKTSADIWALNLLSYRHFKRTVALDRQTIIQGTPMLRIAYDTIKDSALTYPWLIPQNSLNDFIAENQCFDSPFNTYKPYQTFWSTEIVEPTTINIPIFDREKAASKKYKLPEQSSENLVQMSINGLNVEVRFNDKESKNLFKTQYRPKNKKALQTSLNKNYAHILPLQPNYEPIKFFHGNEGRYQLYKAALNNNTGSPLSSYIASTLLENEDLKPADFADKLNLPLNTVLRIFKELHLDTTKVDAKKELKKININENYELKYWADHFSVSTDEIVKAVRKVGSSSKDVKDYFKKESI